MNICSWEIAEIRNVTYLCSTKEGKQERNKLLLKTDGAQAA